MYIVACFQTSMMLMLTSIYNMYFVSLCFAEKKSMSSKNMLIFSV